MTRRSFYKKRQIIDVQNFDEIDFDEKILICVPKFSWLVARSWLGLQGRWESSYAKEYFTNGYEPPDAGEMDTIKANLADFLEATDMSCDLETALGDLGTILQGLVDKDCCAGGGTAGECAEGSGGSGPGEAVAETFEDDGETTFPEFFDDRDAYLDKKCAIARDIINKMLADLIWMEGLATGELLVASFVAALFVPIPGSRVVALVAMLVTLSLNGIMIAVLSAIQDELEARVETLVCLMMQAANVAVAESTFLAELDLTPTEALAADLLVGHDSFNALFNFGDVPGGFTPCNCGSCLCGIFINSGSSSDGINFQSEDIGGGTHSVNIYINQENSVDVCVDACSTERIMEMHNLTGWSECTATNSFQINTYIPVCSSASGVYGHATIPWTAVSGRQFMIFSDTSFTVLINCD